MFHGRFHRKIARQHTRHLVDSFVVVQGSRRGKGDALAYFFGNRHLVRCLCRHLRQVRDYQDLVSRPKVSERISDRYRRCTTDAGVDFVEDKCRWCLRQHQSQGQHRPRQLATRRNSGQGGWFTTRVGRHEEGHLVTCWVAHRVSTYLHLHARTRQGEPCEICLLYTSPSPRDLSTSRMPSSA